MDKNLIVRASVNIYAPIEKVWDALVNPEAIKEYMFGTNVVSDWHEGSSIVWKGEWQSKSYENKGVILQFKPGRIIQYSHFSSVSGLPDKPESYHHTVTIEVSVDGSQSHVSLAQDNNATEEGRAHSKKNWGMILAALKKFLELQIVCARKGLEDIKSCRRPSRSAWRLDARGMPISNQKELNQ